MPEYYCDTKSGICAKSQTDEEKQQGGFLSGDCISSAITKYVELTNKFGNHFDIVCVLSLRKTSSMVRLMNTKQYNEFMSKGKYLIHFIIYNKKTKQYIDTSNNSVLIRSQENLHSQFQNKYNKIYKLYHFPLEWIYKYHRTDMSNFCCQIVMRQYKDPFSKNQEQKLSSQGVDIYVLE
tara:strand:- start:1570 stop:2106 length:537 start_codon:yes stop_codon:yes gene_type:complete